MDRRKRKLALAHVCFTKRAARRSGSIFQDTFQRACEFLHRWIELSELDGYPRAKGTSIITKAAEPLT